MQQRTSYLSFASNCPVPVNISKVIWFWGAPARTFLLAWSLAISWNHIVHWRYSPGLRRAFIKIRQSWRIKFQILDTRAFRISVVKGECGPYIVTAFFICCMWKKLIPLYWGVICPWASTFLKTGKAEKPSASETCNCKARNSESLCWEAGRLSLFRKVLSVLMLKGILGELLSKSLGFIKGGALGFVPSGRGGALGATGAGLVEKSWSIFCCSNWAFCKVSSFIFL